MIRQQTGPFKLTAFIDEFGLIGTFYNTEKKLRADFENFPELRELVYTKFAPLKPGRVDEHFVRLHMLYQHLDANLRHMEVAPLSRIELRESNNMRRNRLLWRAGGVVEMPPLPEIPEGEAPEEELRGGLHWRVFGNLDDAPNQAAINEHIAQIEREQREAMENMHRQVAPARVREPQLFVFDEVEPQPNEIDEDDNFYGGCVEQHIISASISDRGVFEKFDSKGVSKELSPSAQILFELLREYYGKDERASEADVGLLSKMIGDQYPRHKEQLDIVLGRLPDCSAANALDIWLGHKRRLIGNKLASALVENDHKNVSELMEEYRFYEAYEEEDSRTFQGADIGELLERQHPGGHRIPFMPKCVNDTIRGGLVPGHHVVVFGRPESGKSQLVINAAAVMARRGLKVLYGGNEDPAEAILTRFIARLADMDVPEVEDDPSGAMERAQEAGYGNFIYQELVPGTIGEIRGLIEEHKPNVVIIDQIRNLAIRGESLTQKLETAVTRLRTLAKELGVVIISVTQAGESAHGKLALDYNDVEYSNTGVAAQADLMIGVGTNDDMFAQNKLILSICKNKISGVKPVLPVRVNRLRSKIKSEV